MPSTVTDQTGRLRKLVDWVITSWNDIQIMHDDWRWMRTTYSGAVTQGTSKYTAASFSLTRFTKWVKDPYSVTLYATASGVADEGDILFIPWDRWRLLYDRGTQTQNRPVHWSISPADEFCLGPVPDAAYMVRGEYIKGPQTLAANSDIPELPTRFHLIIVWHALIMMARFDEGVFQAGYAAQQFQQMMRALSRDQRPAPRAGGTLA